MRHGWHILGVVLCLAAADVRAAAVEAPDGAPDVGFPVGEELIYKVYWGFIPVAKTRIATRWVERDGRLLLNIRYRTRSNKVIATLYPVDDRLEALIDPDGFLPVEFVKNMREGRHHYHEVTTFDFQNNLARWEDKKGKKVEEFPIDADTRDIVSFMYYMRAARLKPGQTREFRVMADERIYDLTLKAGKSEKVKVNRFGRVSCLKVEPEAQFDGLFVRKGKVTLWISDDERYLCTRLVGSVPVASIKVCLVEVHGPGDDAWVRKTRKIVGKGKSKTDPEVEKALRELDN